MWGSAVTDFNFSAAIDVSNLSFACDIKSRMVDGSTFCIAGVDSSPRQSGALFGVINVLQGASASSKFVVACRGRPFERLMYREMAMDGEGKCSSGCNSYCCGRCYTDMTSSTDTIAIRI